MTNQLLYKYNQNVCRKYRKKYNSYRNIFDLVNVGLWLSLHFYNSIIIKLVLYLYNLYEKQIFRSSH